MESLTGLGSCLVEEGEVVVDGVADELDRIDAGYPPSQAATLNPAQLVT